MTVSSPSGWRPTTTARSTSHRPRTLQLKLEAEFPDYVAETDPRKLCDGPRSRRTPSSLCSASASLFGFARVSQVLKMVERDIRGRLVVFFPGHFERNNYRLLDARDGWNYLAVPITLHGEGAMP